MGYLFIALMLLFEGFCLLVLVGTGITILRQINRAGLLWILSLVTRGNYPLNRELENLGGSVTGKDRYRVAQLISQLYRGRSLGESLLTTPGLVPRDTALLTQVAERQSAGLSPIFAQESARLLRIRQTALTSSSSPPLLMLYLFVIPILMSTILSGIMIFIIPKFKKIFDDFGSELPPLTEALITTSDFVAMFWYVPVAIGMLVAYVGLFWRFRDRFFVKTHLGVPLAWPSSRRKRASLALRAIEIAVRGNQPLENSLVTLAQTHPSEADRRSFQKLCSRLGEGGDTWAALVSSRLISRRDAELFRAAESAGNLPWALHYVIGGLDDRAINRLAVRLELAQPLIVLAIGMLVAFMCIGLFLPLIDLIADLS